MFSFPTNSVERFSRCRTATSASIDLQGSRSHRVLHVGTQRKVELLSTLARDCAWLEAHGRTDYSILIAVGNGGKGSS